MLGKNLTKENIKNSGKPTVYGLTYIPTIEPELSDSDSDIRNSNNWRVGTDDNSPEVLDYIKQYSSGNIMEIGVSLYEPHKSFTHIILNNKKDEDIYFGIDIADRNFINGLKPNSYFKQINSLHFDKVSSEIEKLKIKFDVLIIDGHHSVKNCINDIQYSKFVKVGGYVILHDTNAFPGPICLIEAMDREIFEINEPLLNKKDFGIAICKKIKE